jgi:ADP-ribose pyrophosphatase YjhB (NUDIX family)
VKLPWYILRLYLRARRGMTLGARVAAFDPEGRVLLVKQTYLTSWILPGGGVDRGETIEQAASRELREEANVIANGPLQLHGFFSNDANFRGDHLAVFVTRNFTALPFVPTREISEIAFFDSNNLPPDIDPGSGRRIVEIITNITPAATW